MMDIPLPRAVLPNCPSGRIWSDALEISFHMPAYETPYSPGLFVPEVATLHHLTGAGLSG